MPYVGEIRMFGGSFAPAGWAFCNGATMPISENETLFNLIGTTYGGDGQETFNLPNLCGRAPVHMGTAPSGTTYTQGQLGGVEQVTIGMPQTPLHNHAFLASTGPANANTPINNIVAESVTISPYLQDAPNAQFTSAALQLQGGSQPHDNMQPYLVITFIISLYGVYPSQT